MSDHLPMGAGREFDLIRRMLELWGPLASGVGSDAAIINVPADSRIVASTDASVEDVHFRRGWLSARQIGYRATAAALSDLAAAAVTPIGILVAISAPPTWYDELLDVAAGIGDAARDSGAQIIGGDTCAGPALNITITVFGAAASPLTRAGSRAGDRIWLTGDVGRSAIALAKLQRGESPLPDEMERFASPHPRIREALFLARHGATAAIDISDGLASELGHLAAASGVRLRVELEKTPVRISRGAAMDLQEAMRSGEEYELLVTLPANFAPEAFRVEFRTRLSDIGYVVDGPPGVEIISNGEIIALPGGYDHF